MPTAANVRKDDQPSSLSPYCIIVIGAISFCISDNTIAYCKFNDSETKFSDFFCVFMYHLAELLIYLPLTACY